MALFLAIPLTAYFATQYRLAYLAQQQRLAEWEAEQELERKLETLVEFKFGRKVKLKEWLEEWNRQTRLTAEAIDLAENDLSVGDDFELWLDLPPLPAREALQIFCQLHWGHWSPQRDGRIAVSLETYRRSTDLPLDVRVYPLPPNLTKVDSDVLGDLVLNCCEPDTWEVVGGRGKLELANGHLVLAHYHDQHRLVSGFLQSLEDLLARTADLPAKGCLPTEERLALRLLSPDADQMNRLLQKLDEPVTIDVSHVLLREFLALVSQQTQIPIELDQRESARAIDYDAVRVICQVKDMSLRNALSLALSEHSLHVLPFAGGRGLLISSRSQAYSEGNRYTIACPVNDLLAGPNGRLDFDPLIETVTVVAQPHRGADGNGGGRVHAFENLLIVNTINLDSFWEVRDLLAALRKVRCGAYGPQLKLGFDNVRSERMLASYDQPLALSYRDLPLGEIIGDIRRRSGLPIYATGLELRASGVKPETRFSCFLPARPLWENLAALLDPLQLSVQLHPEFITISPLYYAENYPAPVEVIDLRSIKRRWPEIERSLSDLVSEYRQRPHTFQDLMIVERTTVGGVPATDLAECVLNAVRTRELRWPGVGLIDRSQWHRPLDKFDLDAINKQRIGELLSKRISLQVNNRPMGQILFELAKDHDLPIAPPVIPREGTPIDSLISLDEVDAPLSDILQKLIGDTNVARWQVRHGALCVEDVVYREADRRDALRTIDPAQYAPRWYFVADLLVPRGPLSVEQLTDKLILVDSIRPDPTVNVQILVEPHIHFNSLLEIQATPKQHTQVEQILQDLRQPPREVAP